LKLGVAGQLLGRLDPSARENGCGLEVDDAEGRYAPHAVNDHDMANPSVGMRNRLSGGYAGGCRLMLVTERSGQVEAVS
jgi:hypothetical protein